MNVSNISLSRFMMQPFQQFIIPIYQRNYDWTEKQCAQLLQDIKEVSGKAGVKHFIGSIVSIENNENDVQVNKLLIIDGQQRLTTLTILYIALHHFAQNNAKIEGISENEIRDNFLINSYATREEEKIKLKTFDEGNQRALKFLLSSSDLLNCPDSRVKQNYIFFKDRIDNNNFLAIKQGIEKLYFVNISLSPEDNPQRIFESLNSTGLSLSQADLIRNYILMGVPTRYQERVFTSTWGIIENNTVSRSRNENNTSEFIRDYLTIKTGNIPTISNVYFEFKKLHSNLPVDYSELITELQELVNYSNLYKKILFPTEENEESTNIRKEIEYINFLEITVAYPFIMQVYHDYVNNIINELVFVDVLKLVQTYAIRRFIVGVPTNSLNKVFKSLYRSVDQNNYLLSLEKELMLKTGNESFPRDEEVKDKLKTKDLYSANVKNKKYLLQKMEEYNNPEPVMIKDNSAITIEHIFPQKPCEEWRDDISQEDYNLLQNKYLHTIGNLSLTGGNQKLGNARFIDKRDKEDYGYRASNIWLNNELSNYDRWGMEEFNQRFEVIAQRFIDVWPQPEDNHNREIELVNIFDAGDPSNYDIEVAEFFGQEIKKNSVKEYYVEIIKTLFELDSDKILYSDLSNKIGIVRASDSKRLRNPANIGDDYCIETNNDNITKFNNMMAVLSYMGLEDELFVKLVERKNSKSNTKN